MINSFPVKSLIYLYLYFLQIIEADKKEIRTPVGSNQNFWCVE